MNKLNIVMVILFATFISTGVWATELWNGFTTEMNRSQVEARARMVFGENSSSVQTMGQDFLPIVIEFKLPQPEFVLECIIVSHPTFRVGRFFFLNGRLYMVVITFRASGRELLNAVINDIGQPPMRAFPLIALSYATCSEWMLTDRIVGIIASHSQLYVYDRRYVQ